MRQTILYHKRLIFAALVAAFSFFIGLAIAAPKNSDEDLRWPAATRESRPWTRWWWLGSAVDKTNLTRQLTQFQQAGFGGVEICPIYGAKGYEDRFIDFLSPKWMEMLTHTTREAKRLDLGVDMTTGTGWPFGGPHVSAEDASAKVVLRRFDVAGGATLETNLTDGRLQCLMAFSETGQQTNLTSLVITGRLDWTVPSGQWRLYAVSIRSPLQKVKRAAPGGEGNALDPYSTNALSHYLARFDKAFADYHGEMPRSQFHDSFEYFGGNWTPDFFREFETRRSYDLRTQLPALFGEGPEDTVARVKDDYRQTISDLHLAYIQRWTDWSHSHGSLTRDQAHGAPGNLLDLYAAADIPETESFGGAGELNVPMNKFASSAAHLDGKRLASAESFTWLNEHFQTSLSQVKQTADYLFLCGVNHIFFHGIPYSPLDAPWPGWQFYASVNFGPQGGLWRDLPEFNAYVTRCQSILQSGAPANDVLLYFPIDDVFQKPDDLLIHFTIHNVEKVLGPHPFYAVAMELGKTGYAYDLISDRFLQNTAAAKGRLIVGGNSYRVILVPKMRFMPETTLRKLIQLAKRGATILVQGQLPDDVPGFGNLEKRRTELRTLLASLKPSSNVTATVKCVAVGKGKFLFADDIGTLLREVGVPHESCVDLGLRFVRRTHPQGFHYFLANRGTNIVDGWVTLGTPANSAVILYPRFENRAGVAALRHDADGKAQVYLQLHPGESCILRTFTKKTAAGSPWNYSQPAGVPQTIVGNWKVQFTEGGPVLPASYQTHQLASWTTRDDPEAKRFAGTARYTIEFDKPVGEADDWLLDLGKVCESARVRLNGHDIGVLWCAPFRIEIGKWLEPGKNILEIEVTNLAANRIADLDRRKVNWKYFYDANILGRDYKPLDASGWPLFDSGLLGPVNLIPLKTLHPPAS